MKLQDKCLPCVVNQVIKVANMTGMASKEALLKESFAYLSKMPFDITTPEIIGELFELIKKYSNHPDPYKDIRKHYNSLLMELLEEFELNIERSKDPFQMAIRYAIVGNIIDLNPIHNTYLDDVTSYFHNIDQFQLAIDDSKKLIDEISSANTLLYLGDNCGEICLDKILLKKIKELNSTIKLYFGVRGKAVVNDSIAEDAYSVGIDSYATIIDNGDGSLGTVLHRTSKEFQEIYHKADLVIAKGQSNYECLSEENKNIYFLLMSKCEVIAKDIGVEEKKMICLKNRAYIVS